MNRHAGEQVISEAASAAVVEVSVCRCGHLSLWHSNGGRGDCEHDGDCECNAFDEELISRYFRALSKAQRLIDQALDGAVLVDGRFTGPVDWSLIEDAGSEIDEAIGQPEANL